MERRASPPVGENRKIARLLANNQSLVFAKPVPPGWKRRLYGRQDARRYGAVAGTLFDGRGRMNRRSAGFSPLQ